MELSINNTEHWQLIKEIEGNTNSLEYYNQMSLHLFNGKVYKMLTKDQRDQVDHVVGEVFYK
tara:strand:+ start:88 stop:273 length:186 start_codon:yes stop_codon:yes gene_type:complete